MSAPKPPAGSSVPAPKSRRVLISWERGSGGPVISAAGVLASAGSGIYPRNGYIDLRADWPQERRISILNRRVVEVAYLLPDEDPEAVAKELASRGDFRWP